MTLGSLTGGVSTGHMDASLSTQGKSSFCPHSDWICLVQAGEGSRSNMGSPAYGPAAGSQGAGLEGPHLPSQPRKPRAPEALPFCPNEKKSKNRLNGGLLVREKSFSVIVGGHPIKLGAADLKRGKSCIINMAWLQQFG